jgi:hypothetical protein
VCDGALLLARFWALRDFVPAARAPDPIPRALSAVRRRAASLSTKMPLPLMLDHQETKIRTSKVLTKIRNGQVARFCAIGASRSAFELEHWIGPYFKHVEKPPRPFAGSRR